MSASNVVDLKRDWRVGLKMNAAKCIPDPEPGNAFLMLTNDVFEGCLARDEFGERMYWAKQPPPLHGFVTPRVGEDISDHHTLYVQHYLSRVGIGSPVSFKAEALNVAIAAAARKNSHHPLREYLTGLEWDGTERLELWCHECLGAPLSDYSRAVGRWWMISAVARALDPGCQADHMLLLEGEQGARKSTALRILAGEWYLPELPDVRGKDAAHALHGRWIVECGELEALKRADMTAIKDFLTRKEDIYRPAYGHHFVRRPRSVVFAGTTNDYQSLSDPTGARRFWPMRCTDVDVVKLKNWRDQLWAEAVFRWQSGEQWHPTAQLLPSIRAEQEERYQEDSWEPLVLAWAERHAVASFTLADAMSAVGMAPEKWTRASDTRVGIILSRAGYVCSRLRIGDKRIRHYSKPVSGTTLAPESSEEESDFDE